MNNYNISVGIDVDGVLRNFQSQLAKYIQQVKGIDLEEEDYKDWGFQNVRDASGRKVITDVFANPAVGKYIFEDAPTLTNAYTGFRQFVNNPKITVFIISDQKKEYRGFTDRWLSENGFLSGTYQVSYEKDKLNVPVHMMIDDNPKTVLRFNQNKRDSILINQSYNTDADLPESIARVSDMIDAYDYVLQRYRRYL